MTRRPRLLTLALRRAQAPPRAWGCRLRRGLLWVVWLLCWGTVGWIIAGILGRQ
jgi:hypothetical protein